MENENILEVKDLSVVLDTDEIIHGVSFLVKRGEAIAIIGPNGAGKTVLFRALLGLIPYRGTVTWGKNIRIGYVPQKFLTERGLPLSVKEFFLLQANRFWFPQKSFVDHLDHELNLVGLSAAILKKPIVELSGGQLQRLLIARAMLNHPDVLLFDEPSAGIDIGFEETIYNLMDRMQKELGTTILLISHDLNIVYHHTQNVLCLNKKVACYGRPQEVLNPKDLAGLFGSGKFHIHKETSEP